MNSWAGARLNFDGKILGEGSFWVNWNGRAGLYQHLFSWNWTVGGINDLTGQLGSGGAG
jgi:hypothetical protein